jgi:hypothetical protein
MASINLHESLFFAICYAAVGDKGSSHEPAHLPPSLSRTSQRITHALLLLIMYLFISLSHTHNGSTLREHVSVSRFISLFVVFATSFSHL